MRDLLIAILMGLVAMMPMGRFTAPQSPTDAPCPLCAAASIEAATMMDDCCCEPQSDSDAECHMPEQTPCGCPSVMNVTSPVAAIAPDLVGLALSPAPRAMHARPEDERAPSASLVPDAPVPIA